MAGLLIFLILVALLEGSYCYYAWFYCQVPAHLSHDALAAAQDNRGVLGLPQVPPDLDSGVEPGRPS